MDHLGDPLLMPNDRIRLGVEGCKGMLRSGIKAPDFARRDNLIIAIGGVTARQGLRNRLAWGGIPVERLDDGSVECADSFLLLAEGPLEWRTEFPDIANFVDPVNQGHRVGRIEVRRESGFRASRPRSAGSSSGCSNGASGSPLRIVGHARPVPVGDHAHR